MYLEYTEADINSEHHLVGHHRRLVGPGPARPALGYATACSRNKKIIIVVNTPVPDDHPETVDLS